MYDYFMYSLTLSYSPFSFHPQNMPWTRWSRHPNWHHVVRNKSYISLAHTVASFPPALLIHLTDYPFLHYYLVQISQQTTSLSCS